tara:strand:- start:751 stop:1326 length:576 start_codon:yes stop_codon:yes gene_type:complete
MINDIISIKIMSEIFKEANIKVKPATQMIYQSVLNHWFSNQAENISNLAKFTMFKVDIRYDSLKSHYDTLQKAGLVHLSEHKVTFLDAWSNLVPTHRLHEVKHKLILADDCKEEMYNSHSLRDLMGMRYKINRKQSQELLNMFFAEQGTIQQNYNNIGAVKKHFIYWSQNNLEKVKSQTNVKSAAKILGKN